MKGPSPLRALFDDLRDALERLDVPYAVMGGVAVGVGAQDAIGFLEGLESEGFLVPDAFRTGWTDHLAGTRKLAVKKFVGGHVWDVDVFLEESKVVRSVMDRRQFVELDGRPGRLREETARLCSPGAGDLTAARIDSATVLGRTDLVLHLLNQAYPARWGPPDGLEGLVDRILAPGIRRGARRGDRGTPGPGDDPPRSRAASPTSSATPAASTPRA